ncbi:hypothetical protein Tco_0506989, partial [Tanacetum coccineum]
PMAALQYKDDHNRIAYLGRERGSEDFTDSQFHPYTVGMLWLLEVLFRQFRMACGNPMSVSASAPM